MGRVRASAASTMTRERPRFGQAMIALATAEGQRACFAAIIGRLLMAEARRGWTSPQA